MGYQNGKIVIFSGAGVSAESGLSTFRDEGGLWASHDPNVVCNLHNWLQNYDLVHSFYNQRRAELATTQPNAAHRAVKRLCDEFETINITQNVDDLFEKAGCRDVLHLHGHLTSLRCVECEAIIELGYAPYAHAPCPKCGAKRLKPNIVFFGESAPNYAKMHRIFSDINAEDIIVVVGTSGEVIDICGLLGYLDSRRLDSHRPDSAPYKILNNLRSERFIDEGMFDRVFLEPASSALPKIYETIRALKKS